MAIVHIRVGNRQYDVACDDGQEDHLRLLSDDVDERVRSLLFSMGGNVGDNMALLLTCLTLADELAESKREVQAVAADVAHLSRQLDRDQQQARISEMEGAMAGTLNEIASRIEKIAQQIEIQ